MAEYIEREALAEKLWIDYCGNCSAMGNELKCRCCDVDDVLSEIEDAPAADVVEVVRCKDCRSGELIVCDYYCCRNDSRMDGNDFCSYGEKKDK